MRIMTDTSDLDRFAADCARAPELLTRAYADAAQSLAEDGNRAGRVIATRNSGRHGKLYPRSWRVDRIGATEFRYGPDPSMPQGSMDFEEGSGRQAKPHLDALQSADIIRGVAERRVGAAVDRALQVLG